MNADSSVVQHAPATLTSSASLVMRMLEGVRGGTLNIVLPNGERSMVGDGHLVATWEVRDWSVFDHAVATGTIGFAEDFIAGRWHTDRLAPMLTLLANNRPALARAIHGNVLRLLAHRLRHVFNRNTRTGSRRNIEAHYDLGNDFYALWLDETMSYSSGLFRNADDSLADAQRAKYRRVLDQLGLRPGQRILEIGCGWGGLAEVACREYGARVHGITLSPSQLAWARARAEREGFADQAAFDLCDYRDVRGRYDHIVSIEMVEAVGERYWPGYFRVLRERLAPGGTAAIQSITIADELFGDYRSNVDFIQRYIFPGGMLPAPAQIHRQARRAHLHVVDDFGFGHDYARTLVHWHRRFNEQLDAVRAQGFDERFVRMWQFYLAYCEAGFMAGSTDVRHYAFRHAAP